MPDTLETEIENAIAEHQRWRGHDFNLAQILFWASIITSFVAGLSAFAAWIPRPVTGIIAAIPAVALLITKAFNHAGRSSWHSIYVLKLRALQRRLRDQGATSQQVSEELGKLEEEMQKTWPELNAGALPQSAKPNDVH
jgi:hypothetical protein